MKQVIQEIRRFDKGIQGTVDSAFHQHFDIFSDPYRLIPYRSTEAEADSVSAANLGTSYLRNFQLGKNGIMYALGQTSTLAQVFQKTDPTTGTWGVAATAVASATFTVIYGAFIEWGVTPAFYMFTKTATLSKWQIGGTFTDTVLGLGATITSVAQGVIGADDNLYMFYNNRVVRVTNAGTATDNVLTNLPSDMRIVSACRLGTYIAIGMAYGTSAIGIPAGVSKVFIWDMVTTTTTNDVLDWGEGALRVLGNIEGRLVGVSDKYLTNPISLSRGSMVVRMWSGGTPQIMKEIIANQLVTADSGTYANVVSRFPRDVVIKDNKMYWIASVPFGASTATESTFHLGIWAFGRKDKDSDFSLSLDYVEEGVDTANFYINSFGNAGNYWFISYSAAGLVNKTDDAANYTFTSAYETELLGNGKQTFKLVATSVMTDFLPAAGQIVLKYKVDAESSFTTIFTNTTDNSIRHTALNIESTGATLPTYKRLRLRAESTGGAVITGIRHVSEPIDDDVYA